MVLNFHSSPARRAPRWRGRLRGALLAGEAACAARARGLCPLDSRWGYAPDPEMLTHLCLACGRDGGWVRWLFMTRCWPARQKAGGPVGLMLLYICFY